MSVVIAAPEAGDELARALDAIGRSEFDLDGVEIVVVADLGSSEAVAAMLRARRSGMRVVRLRDEGAGLAAATNEALAAARGACVLLLDPHVRLHPAALREHLAWHERFAGQEVAVLGALPYADDLEITPFLFHRAHGTTAPRRIEDPQRVPPVFLHAAHLSLPRAALVRLGGLDPQLGGPGAEADLGFRLVEGGVRLVYNAQAIGHRAEPLTLEEASAREEQAGAAHVRLCRKHPDHEERTQAWDVAVRHGLGYSRLEHDRDLAEIERLERAIVTAHPEYQDLWRRSAEGRAPLASFTERQQRTLATCEALFAAYDRVLRHHWAAGFRAEALRQDGPRRSAAIVRARLARQQLPSCTLRLVGRRLRECGIDPGRLAGGPHPSARVIHGLDDYAAAARCLAPYQPPGPGGFAQHTVLVLERGRFAPAELERLDEAVETVVCDGSGAGIHEALRRVRAEVIVVAAARFDLPDPRVLEVAGKLFARFGSLAVLGGGVREGHRVRYGWRARDGAAAEPLLRPCGDAEAPAPIDAANAELLVLRRSAVEPVLDRPWSGAGWNLELCRRLAERGGQTLYVPEYVTSALDSGARTAVPERG